MISFACHNAMGTLEVDVRPRSLLEVFKRQAARLGSHPIVMHFLSMRANKSHK